MKKGIVNINCAKVLNFVKVVVSNIPGKTILKKTVIQQNESIDLSGFESGIYIVRIQTEDEIVTRKIVKE